MCLLLLVRRRYRAVWLVIMAQSLLSEFSVCPSALQISLLCVSIGGKLDFMKLLHEDVCLKIHDLDITMCNETLHI